MSRIELAKAINDFQKELTKVKASSENPFFKSKYADLGSIMKETQPKLTAHGLSVVQLPSNIDGAPALTTVLMHTSGETLESTTPLILDKQNAQAFGSAMTYTRRYAYAAVLQIVIDEDDDGNKASTSKKAHTPPKKPTVDLATDKQRKLISDKLGYIGFTEPEQIKHYLSTEYGINDKLSKEDAKMVISDLLNNEEQADEDQN